MNKQAELHGTCSSALGMQPSWLLIDDVDPFSAIERAVTLVAGPLLVCRSPPVYPSPDQGRQGLVITVTIVIMLVFQWVVGDDLTMRIVIGIVTTITGQDLLACSDDGVTIPCPIQAVGSA